MKFCIFCREELPEKAVFCSGCGEKQPQAKSLAKERAATTSTNSGVKKPTKLSSADLKELAQKCAGILAEINPHFSAYSIEVTKRDGAVETRDYVAVLDPEIYFFENSKYPLVYLADESDGPVSGWEDLDLDDYGFDSDIYDYGSECTWSFYGKDAQAFRDPSYVSQLQKDLHKSTLKSKTDLDAKDFIAWTLNYLETLSVCNHSFQKNGICKVCKLEIDLEGVPYWNSGFLGSSNKLNS